MTQNLDTFYDFGEVFIKCDQLNKYVLYSFLVILYSYVNNKYTTCLSYVKYK